MISELLVFVCGLYIGKYYSEYVPIPRIHQADIDAVLAYLKSIQTAPAPTTPQPAATSAATSAAKNDPKTDYPKTD